MGLVPQWAIGVVVIIVTVATAQAVLRMLGIKSGRSTAHSLSTSEDTAELRQAIEVLQNRLAEVEDRLDFAERLLAKQRDAERLGPPPG
jgi:hypothetical protein